MALAQNTNVAFINTINTHSTFPATSYNTGSYYGTYLTQGTVSLVDNSGVSAFGPLGAIYYSKVVGAPVYTSTAAEIDGVVTYTEAGTLLANTNYYFTLTQLIPNVIGNQQYTETIQFQTGSVTSQGTVATGLGAIIALLPGFHVTTGVATGVLTVTAAAGYPILTASGVDGSGAVIAQGTTGVVSVGRVADMTANGYSTLTGYNSSNNYDKFVINYNRLVNGVDVAYQSIIFINSGDANHTNLKNQLTAGNAHSIFNLQALETATSDTISFDVLSKQ